MSELRDHHGEEPLAPVYPFNSPSASITLYDGLITKEDGEGRAGKVELKLAPKPSLCWSIQPDGADKFDFTKETVQLRLDRSNGLARIEAQLRDDSSGWINEVRFEHGGKQLRRVLVHWLNLPEIIGHDILEESDESGTRWWRGRFRMECSGWKIVLDARRDHRRVTQDANDESVYVITHVMEVERADGGEFTVKAVEALIECLRVCFSFGFGRWVAPALPVGYDTLGRVAWERWVSPICDPYAKIGSGWLYKGSAADVVELIEKGVSAFGDPARSGVTRFQMCSAVQAVGSGFLEQRIMAAAPALENLAWSDLVLGRKMRKTEYQDCYAEDRLRYLLQEARISTEIEEDLLPGLASFACRNRIDGPTAVTRVRNSLVHPKDLHDQVYRHDGLMVDTWFLTLHYVRLIILHSIGYAGSYMKLHKRGWVGGTERVPWADRSQSSGATLPKTKKDIRRAKRSRK